MSPRAHLVAVAFLGTALSLSLDAQPSTTGKTVVIHASNSSNNVVTLEHVQASAVNSPRDPASGQATGRRVHQPIAARASAQQLQAGPLSLVTNEAMRDWEIRLTLSGKTSGDLCRVSIPVPAGAQSSRVDVRAGDVARFFDADGKPRRDACEK